MSTLTCLVREAQLLNTPNTCSNILHAVGAAQLIPVLNTAYISNAEAAYGSRTDALELLTLLTACVHSTQGPKPGSGSAWDAPLLGCLGSVIRYVCMPKHDTRLGGFKGRQLLRQALTFLKGMVHALPPELWSEAWQQVSPLQSFCPCRMSKVCHIARSLSVLQLLLLFLYLGQKSVQTHSPSPKLMHKNVCCFGIRWAVPSG